MLLAAVTIPLAQGCGHLVPCIYSIHVLRPQRGHRVLKLRVQIPFWLEDSSTDLPQKPRNTALHCSAAAAAAAFLCSLTINGNCRQVAGEDDKANGRRRQDGQVGGALGALLVGGDEDDEDQGEGQHALQQPARAGGQALEQPVGSPVGGRKAGQVGLHGMFISSCMCAGRVHESWGNAGRCASWRTAHGMGMGQVVSVPSCAASRSWMLGMPSAQQAADAESWRPSKQAAMCRACRGARI